MKAMYDFDQLWDRKGTNCLKWDATETFFGKKDLLPLWVADMDFPVAPGIRRALQARLDQAVFGYSQLSPAYFQAVADWMDRRHHWTIQPEWITYTSGVVSALFFAVEALTQPGDQVMILTPVYGPFYRAVESQGREALRVPLAHDDRGYYSLDMAAMEQAVTAKTKALLLCSPHNPVGRVWTRAELEQIADFCQRHDLYIIDDEIHNDLVFEKDRFVTLGRLGQAVEERSVVCTAITKTFNLADLQVSNIIIPNPKLREAFRECTARHHVGPHSFSEPALLGAYRDSEDWLDELLVYIRENVRFFQEQLAERMPLLSLRPPEGTYLVWVDCRKLGLSDEALRKFFVEDCGLALNPGTDFGGDWGQYVRVNMACPRAYIREAVDRIEQAWSKRG